MYPLDRRSLLRYGGAGTLAALAGCLGDLPGSGETDDIAADDDIDVDVFQTGPTNERPPWDEFDGVRRGAVTVIDSPDALPRRVLAILTGDDERDADDASDEPADSDTDASDEPDDSDAVHDEPDSPGDATVDDLEDWIEETDFEESVVLHVESVGPNTCFGELAVSDVRIESEPIETDSAAVEADQAVIAGTAEAVDVSEPDEVCGQAITYPSALVRVTPAEPSVELPDVAQFTVVDGWGESSVEDSIRGVLSADDLPGYVEPPHDPRTIPPALECPDDDFERLRSARDEEVVYGETVDDDGRPLFAMRVENPQYAVEDDATGEDDSNSGDSADDDATDEDVARALSFERGDEVRITLRNVSNTRATTGNPAKYNLEVRTEDGWQDVRGHDPDASYGYTDEAYLHPPGTGLDWTFTLTEDGIADESIHAEHLRVCPDLQPGRYRFRFWSVAGAESVAVAFDLVE